MVIQHKGVGSVENSRMFLYFHPLQGPINMHGRVGGFTNTEVGLPRSLSRLLRPFEMTSISFSPSSSSYCAIVMSAHVKKRIMFPLGSLKCSSTIDNSSNSTLLDVSAFTVSSESKIGCGGNSSSSIKCSSIAVT
ncbi:hypothetical protein Scep_025874 [Stephania cephalantha]|uniref:Uncharacterized protein n=1 Tax=Stephania cephalantha TaxID=152367 RepID=A0AAP0EJ12_9MAGN